MGRIRIHRGTDATRLAGRSLPTLVMLLAVLCNPSAGQDTLKLEAEDALLSGVNIGTSSGGYSGSGYVQGFDAEGDRITFSFTMEPGLYRVIIGYSTPYGEKGFGLTINEAGLGGMFPASGGSFREHEAGRIILREGENVAVITNGWGWFFVDYLQFIPASVTPPEPPPDSLTDPDALGSTREVFGYLLGSYGEKVLSGQQTLQDISYIESVTGRIPAVGVFDFMDYSVSRQERGAIPDETTEEIINWHKATGGLVSISWHWNAPTDLIDETGKEWWRGFYTYATTFDLAGALADTTSWRYLLLMRDMDVVANELRKLHNEGIPVLWRPLHEASGGWFWWGARGKEPYRQLWRIMHDRFTRHFGLHNLIWVSTHGDYDWYPGDEFVDVVGLDIYETPGATMSGQWEGEQAHFNGRKLLALSESGTIPDPENIINYATWWSWFSMWSGSFPREAGESVLQQVYNDTLIITVDELPLWNWEIPDPLAPFEVTDPDVALHYMPEAGDVTFTGEMFVGSTLTGSYSYHDLNGDEEGASIYRWYDASDAEGSDAAVISGAEGITYVIGEELRERYVAFEVTPVAATGSAVTLEGNAVRSGFLQVSTVGTGGSASETMMPYPVPFSGRFTVEGAAGFSAILLTDAMGRMVQRISLSGQERVDLELSTAPAGIYYLQLFRKDGSTEIRKVMKN